MSSSLVSQSLRWSRAIWQRRALDEVSARWASTASTNSTTETDASAPTTPAGSTTSDGTTTSAGPSSQTTTEPKVVVFGGSGFVGSAVCEEAVNLGVKVTSVSRGGRPSFATSADWASGVEWLRSDVGNDEGQWREALDGASGVISTLGAFGSNKFMYQVCGAYNIKLLHAAKEAGVDRFSFISVHDFAFPGGWQAQNFLLRGYFQGKRDAEAEMAKLFQEKGVALRPGMIYGTRHVGNMSLPLGVVGMPLEAVVSRLPKSLSNIPIVGCAFVPPVSVQSVAKAALMAVLDPEVSGGCMSVWDIQKYSG